MRRPRSPRDRVLCALDVPSGREALRLARLLEGEVGGFKVGMRLFTAEGPTLVRRLVERGARVFLDLKYHDTPQTVADACREAARLGVDMVDVHASGGPAMVRAAAEALRDEARGQGRPAPLLLAVTVLTSLDRADLARIGIRRKPETQVLLLARMAVENGAGGVVASAREAALLRRELGPEVALVTPGIRPEGTALGGQKRVMGPRDAVLAGADWIVVGRPIVAASDPRRAARAVVAEIAGGAGRGAARK